MTIKKRLRVLWAALTQTWVEHRCACGATQWVEGVDFWSDPTECVDCEAKAFDAWEAKWHARQRSAQGVL